MFIVDRRSRSSVEDLLTMTHYGIYAIANATSDTAAQYTPEDAYLYSRAIERSDEEGFKWYRNASEQVVEIVLHPCFTLGEVLFNPMKPTYSMLWPQNKDSKKLKIPLELCIRIIEEHPNSKWRL